MYNKNCFHFSFLLILVVGYTEGMTTTQAPPPFMTYQCDGDGKVTDVTIPNEHVAHVNILTKTGGYCKPNTKDLNGVKGCITSFYESPNPKTDKITLVTILYGDIIIDGIVGGLRSRYYTLSCLGKVGIVTAAMNAINVGTVIPTKQTVFHSDSKQTPQFTVLNPASQKYVGDLITLQMTVSSNYVLLPQSCSAYNPVGQKQKYTFWEHCQVTNAAIIPSETWRNLNTQATIQIDMYAFRFVDTTDLIIKCQTTICPIDDVAPCNMTCDGTRKKRDTNNHQPQKNSTSAILSLALQVFDRQFQENSSQALSPILYIYTIGIGIIYWITVKL